MHLFGIDREQIILVSMYRIYILIFIIETQETFRSNMRQYPQVEIFCQ